MDIYQRFDEAKKKQKQVAHMELILKEMYAQMLPNKKPSAKTVESDVAEIERLGANIDIEKLSKKFPAYKFEVNYDKGVEAFSVTHKTGEVGFESPNSHVPRLLANFNTVAKSANLSLTGMEIRKNKFQGDLKQELDTFTSMVYSAIQNEQISDKTTFEDYVNSFIMPVGRYTRNMREQELMFRSIYNRVTDKNYKPDKTIADILKPKSSKELIKLLKGKAGLGLTLKVIPDKPKFKKSPKNLENVYHTFGLGYTGGLSPLFYAYHKKHDTVTVGNETIFVERHELEFDKKFMSKSKVDLSYLFDAKTSPASFSYEDFVGFVQTANKVADKVDSFTNNHIGVTGLNTFVSLPTLTHNFGNILRLGFVCEKVEIAETAKHVIFTGKDSQNEEIRIFIKFDLTQHNSGINFKL